MNKRFSQLFSKEHDDDVLKVSPWTHQTERVLG